jgi:Na+-transporting methylmalonyl-CoA/oxaloacetate decarboxylase gamma subunit
VGECGECVCACSGVGVSVVFVCILVCILVCVSHILLADVRREKEGRESSV